MPTADPTLAILERELATARAERDAAQNLHQAVVDGLPGVFYLFDERGQLLRWNRKLEEVSGYSGEELARMSVLDMFNEPDKSLVADRMKQVFSVGHGLVEASFVAKDQSETPYLFSGSQFQLDGKPCLVGLGLDITERKRAEEALRNSESKYRVLFEDSADATMMLNAGGFVDCNAATLQMFGIGTRAEFTALRPADISPLSQADGTPSAVAADQRVAAAFVHGKNRFEWLHQRAGGDVFPAEVFLTALTLDGQPVLMATVRDVTERTRAGEELRQKERLLSDSQSRGHIGSWLFDTKRSISWSEEMYRLFGVSPETFIPTEEALLTLVHPDDRPAVRSWFVALAAGTDPGDMDHRVILPDGTVRFLRGRGAAVADDANRFVHAVGTVQDITALKLAEVEREKWEAKFQQAQRLEAVGTLAGGIAHDFNNILGAMLGCTELAAMDAVGNQAVLRNLEQVTAAGRRATELVQHILAFSGQSDAALQPIHLEPIVTEALALLRASFPASVELRCTVTAPVPAVLANPTQIHQIIMNLGINAWHAMMDRPGAIDVALDVVEGDDTRVGPRAGRCVRLSVRDSGQGMRPATRARIFEPFFTTKAPGKGTGLGLSTVHGIMKSCHGEISVSSRLGEGTTFELYFPAMAVETADAGVGDAPVPRGRGQRVLFVDDEPSLVAWATDALERLGYCVTGHTSAPDALTAVTRDASRFDLVISDLTMPAMTGFELAEGIRAVRPDLPVIFTTGYSSVMTAARIQEYGVNAFVLKPVGFKTLGHAVHRVFHGEE